VTETTTISRIRSVLLAGSPYDAFLLEQAGFRRHGSGVSEAPAFDLVPSGAETIKFCKEARPDLIIADFSLPDMSAFELGQRLQEQGISIPVVVVTSRSELGGISETSPGRSHVQGLFIWYGDPEVLRTLVRLFEDEKNAEAQLASKKALAILLVEDEPNFFSHYLPMLYTQIRRSTLDLFPDEVHPSCPWSRVKSRPLVLLRQDFEGACQIVDRYSSQLIAIVTDLQYPVAGKLNEMAGLDLLARARAYEPHIPVVVQSRQIGIRKQVEEAGGYFLWKDSPRLMKDMREYLSIYCGFGPFVFRFPDGTEWARATTLDGLRALVAGAPQTVYEHHANHNDFSAWLGVHGYGALAAAVRQVRNSGFAGRQRVAELLDVALRDEMHGGL
jgi:CheY-like chemotaxis protein